MLDDKEVAVEGAVVGQVRVTHAVPQGLEGRELLGGVVDSIVGRIGVLQVSLNALYH